MNNKDKHSFIKVLIEIFNKNNISSLEFKEGDLEIKLKKQLEDNIINTSTKSNNIPTVVPSKVSELSTTSIPVKEAEESNDYSNHGGAVKSPTVGVIYTRPSPEENPFVVEGINVKAGDTLFLLEVMKVFNPIKAHKSGKLIKILVKEHDIVEYNEVLAIIE